jgi:hypothetical protein
MASTATQFATAPTAARFAAVPTGPFSAGEPRGLRFEIVRVGQTGGALIKPDDRGGGRAVYFVPGTAYYLLFESWRPYDIAVMVWIDGQKLFATPLLMRAAGGKVERRNNRRKYSNKNHSRKVQEPEKDVQLCTTGVSRRPVTKFTTERVHLGGGAVRTTAEGFVAVRSDPDGPHDESVGTVVVQFYHTRTVYAKDEAKQCRLVYKRQPTPGGCAGKLKTAGREPTSTREVREEGPRRVACESLGQPFAVTIYEAV